MVGDRMGTRETAARLGVALRTLYRLIDEGRLRFGDSSEVVRVRVVAGLPASDNIHTPT